MYSIGVRQPHTLQSVPPAISSTRWTPPIAIRISVTRDPMLYFSPRDYLVTANLYFTIPSPSWTSLPTLGPISLLPWTSVLVSRVAITKCQRPVGNIFSQFWRLGSKIKVTAELVSPKDSLPGFPMAALLLLSLYLVIPLCTHHPGISLRSNSLFLQGQQSDGNSAHYNGLIGT